MQGANTIFEVSRRNKFRMLTRDEQDIAEPLFLKRPGLAFHLIQRQGDTQDRVIAREATVAAVVDAFIGEVERREETNHLAETLLGQLVLTPGKRFEQFHPRRRNQMR